MAKKKREREKCRREDQLKSADIGRAESEESGRRRREEEEEDGLVICEDEETSLSDLYMGNERKEKAGRYQETEIFDS